VFQGGLRRPRGARSAAKMSGVRAIQRLGTDRLASPLGARGSPCSFCSDHLRNSFGDGSARIPWTPIAHGGPMRGRRRRPDPRPQPGRHLPRQGTVVERSSGRVSCRAGRRRSSVTRLATTALRPPQGCASGPPRVTSGWPGWPPRRSAGTGSAKP